MFRYIFLGFVAFQMVSSVYALTMTNSEIKQKHVGNVEARLEANNIINSTIQNTASGNTFVANTNANVQGAGITQENSGNIFSELTVNNVANQVIQHNVAGTVVVIN